MNKKKIFILTLTLSLLFSLTSVYATDLIDNFDEIVEEVNDEIEKSEIEENNEEITEDSLEDSSNLDDFTEDGLDVEITENQGELQEEEEIDSSNMYWDSSKYEFEPEDSIWHVDNRKGMPNHIRLFYMLKPGRYESHNKNAYGFWVSDTKYDPEYEKWVKEIEDEGHTYYSQMMFPYYSENKKIYKTINGEDGNPLYEVWLWQFGVMDGKYYFAGEDMDWNDYTLNEDLSFDNKANIDTEPFILGAGNRDVNVYTFWNGLNEELADEDIVALQKFAFENEGILTQNAAETEQTLTVKQDNSSATVSIEEVKDDEPVLEEIKEKKEDKEPIDIKKILIGVVCVLFLVFGGFIYGKTR